MIAPALDKVYGALMYIYIMSSTGLIPCSYQPSLSSRIKCCSKYNYYVDCRLSHTRFCKLNHNNDIANISMRSQIAQRLRSSSLQSSSLSSVPPPPTSSEYSTTFEKLAIRILYRSPLPSQHGLPVFILNAAAFPDPKIVDYDTVLPYVLARLPGEEELIGGQGYEVVFFAGGNGDGVTAIKRGRPGLGWFVQAYHLLTRATRKRLQKLYIVHERSWIRMLVEMFSTIVSPKFRKKIVHGESVCDSPKQRSSLADSCLTI